MKKKKKVRYRLKKKYRRRLLVFVLCLILVVTCFHVACSGSSSGSSGSQEITAFNDTTFTEGSVTLFDTYGTSFNLEASFDDANTVNGVSLVLKDLYTGEDSSETALLYTQNGSTVSVYEENALSGLNLEAVGTGDYAIMLKVDDGQTDDNGDAAYTYVTLTDGSGGLEDIDYWTITDNGTNNEITTAFTSYNNTNYMALTCAEGEKPSDVADFVTDPGHGGLDGGTTTLDGSICEADVVLEYAEALQTILENAGYTVVLSRDSSDDPNENTAYTMYDSGGRIERMMECHAKIALSLHCNSVEDDVTSGVQVYVSHVSDGVLGEQLVDEIVNSTDMDYSEVEGLTQRAEGVYEYTFSEEEVAEAEAEGSTSITTDTDYYFMIRETGGIVTGAFVDGSNPLYSANAYRDTNAGLETLLVEMGFLSSTHDLNVLENEEDEYVQAMADALTAYASSLK